MRLAMVVVFAIVAAVPNATAGERTSAELAMDFFDRELPSWVGQVEARADDASTELMRRIGLNVDVVQIECGGTRRSPDGSIIVVKCEHRFVWRLAVERGGGRVWRIQGFEQSDLRDLVQSRAGESQDDATVLRSLTTAFSGHRLFARLLLDGQATPAVVRDLAAACGKAPAEQSVRRLLPQRRPKGHRRWGLVVSSNCSDVFVEWWRFETRRDGSVVVGKTKRLSSLSF